MTKGDIILIPFPFTDLSGNKNRPAVILITSEDDVTVCFITTQLKRQSSFDLIIEPSEFNGLKKTSVIRLNKIATVDKSLVIGKLGELGNSYLQELNQNLIEIFKLWNTK